MTLPSEKPATDVAAQCFLNALIRETTDWKLTEYPPDELLIPLDEQKSLHFRVAYFSPTQHHRFAFPARLVTASGSYPVDFTTLSRLITPSTVSARSPLRNFPPARAGKPCPYATGN